MIMSTSNVVATVTSCFAIYFFTGSPYELNVGVSHKKGEVMVSGPGLENGVLHHYNSNFLVNTTNAGSGELKVSIMGPRGM